MFSDELKQPLIQFLFKLLHCFTIIYNKNGQKGGVDIQDEGGDTEYDTRLEDTRDGIVVYDNNITTTKSCWNAFKTFIGNGGGKIYFYVYFQFL